MLSTWFQGAIFVPLSGTQCYTRDFGGSNAMVSGVEFVTIVSGAYAGL